jgi:hypothetical protein
VPWFAADLERHLYLLARQHRDNFGHARDGDPQVAVENGIDTIDTLRVGEDGASQSADSNDVDALVGDWQPALSGYDPEDTVTLAGDRTPMRDKGERLEERVLIDVDNVVISDCPGFEFDCGFLFGAGADVGGALVAPLKGEAQRVWPSRRNRCPSQR